VVHVGDTVEWTNVDPTEPHTVTFVGPGGTEPGAGVLVGVTVDADGARHGSLPDNLSNAVPCNTNCFNPGTIGAAIQDQTNQPQPTSVTRARVTFTAPGKYSYFCILHDELGMTGQVLVLP
jgi:plastocyanin